MMNQLLYPSARPAPPRRLSSLGRLANSLFGKRTDDVVPVPAGFPEPPTQKIDRVDPIAERVKELKPYLRSRLTLQRRAAIAELGTLLSRDTSGIVLQELQALIRDVGAFSEARAQAFFYLRNDETSIASLLDGTTAFSKYFLEKLVDEMSNAPRILLNIIGRDCYDPEIRMRATQYLSYFTHHTVAIALSATLVEDRLAAVDDLRFHYEALQKICATSLCPETRSRAATHLKSA